MNSDDLRLLLAERAADVDTDQPDRVGAVQRKVRAARRARAVSAAAGAVALAAVVGVALTVPGSDPRSEEPVAPPTPTPSDALDKYRTVPFGEATPLEPGEWRLRADGFLVKRVVLDIPRGYEGDGPFLFAIDGPEHELAAVGYWGPSSVFENPCRSNGSTTPVGTAKEMASALAGQALSRTTVPVPVSLGGYDGFSLELTSPTDLDFKTCDRRTYSVFSTSYGSRYMSTPGETDRYWILEVDGEVAVLNTAVTPGVTDRQREELAQIVESAQFPDDE